MGLDDRRSCRFVGDGGAEMNEAAQLLQEISAELAEAKLMLLHWQKLHDRTR
jgi:hypothetical protein